MEFRFTGRAEIIRLQRVCRTSEIFHSVAGFQTREGEMGGVSARFSGEADGRERGADLGKFLRIGFAQEFQRDMHGFGADPARGAAFRFQALAERREGVAYRAGQVEGDEEAHGLGSGSGGCGKKIIAAHGIERGLRGKLANALAIAGKAIGALAGAVLVGETDVDEADGFFRRAAAGTSDSGDADAESRASAFADAVSERQCDFGADRAFCFDQTLRNAYQRNFQLIAVADYAAEKIGRAAWNPGE